jgi:hypothetical protein
VQGLSLKARQGKIIHDAAQRMALTRELDYKVRDNVKTITQILHLMKLQAKETGMLQESVGNWINETGNEPRLFLTHQVTYGQWIWYYSKHILTL